MQTRCTLAFIVHSLASDGRVTRLTMKLKILIGAILFVIGLHFLNQRLNEAPRYMESSPSTGTPLSGEVRQKFVVGFLPVT